MKERFVLTGAIVLLLSALVLNVSNRVDGQSVEDDTPWKLAHYDKGIKELNKQLHIEWKRADGELTFEIADKMFWAMLLEPDAFYTEMAPDTSSLAFFETDIDKLIFWNPNDTSTAELKRLKVVAVERLKSMTYSVSDANRQIHQSMIKAIESARVTAVD